MSAVRTITFNATVSGVTPTGPQDAGVQGDHNATQVVWSLDAALINPDYRYRCEFVDGAGGWDTTQYLTPSADKTIAVSLPRAWTAAGGCGVIRLCVSEFLDGAEERSLYTLTGRLQFAGRENGGACAAAYETKLPVLIEEVTEAMDGAADAAAQANTAAAGANAAAAAASEAAASADAVADQVQQKLDRGEFIGPRGPVGPKGDVGPQGPQGVSGVYVGEGEMPAGYNVQIDPSGEADVCITKTEADSRYAGALTESASGMIAALTEAAAAPLRRLAVRGETRESGTGGKSPTNPYTLAGAMPANATACGKNILSGRASPGSMNGISWTVDADGAIHPTGTATAQANIVLLPDINKPYFWIDKPIFTSADSAKGLTLKVVNKDGVVSWRGIYATQGNMPPYCGILSAYFQYSAGETASGTLYPYIGLEASQPYEPYTGTTAALSSLAPLYGDGTVNDEYDAATGILTKRWNTLVLDSSLSYSMDAGAQHEEYDTIWVQMTSWFAGTSSSNVYCTHLNPVAPLSLWTDDIVGIALATNGRIQMRVPKSIATSVETLKTWLDSQKNAGTPVTVVYPVGTTGVTQHDPVRLVPIAPDCWIFTDDGRISATYCLDTQRTLERKEKEADSRYSNALTGTASGAMAHITDVSGIGSLRRLAVRGETVEAGTGDKGPDHPYAVAGVVPAAVSTAGKNLIGLESPYQIASTVEGIGSATVERYNNGVTLTMPAASSHTWAAERLWWPITAGTYTLRVKMETNDSAFTPALGVYLKKTLTDTAVALTTVTASGSKTIKMCIRDRICEHCEGSGTGAEEAIHHLREYRRICVY